MPKIKAITKYTYKDKEYSSLKELQSAISDVIGREVLDPIMRKIDIRHKDILILFEMLTSKEIRDVLIENLNITYTWTDEDGDEETINILDIKP